VRTDRQTDKRTLPKTIPARSIAGAQLTTGALLTYAKVTRRLCSLDAATVKFTDVKPRRPLLALNYSLQSTPRARGVGGAVKKLTFIDYFDPLMANCRTGLSGVRRRRRGEITRRQFASQIIIRLCICVCAAVRSAPDSSMTPKLWTSSQISPVIKPLRAY